MAVGGTDGRDDGIHVAQQKGGNSIQTIEQQIIIAVGKEIVGPGEQEKRVRFIGPGKSLACIGSSLGLFRAQAQPVFDVGPVKSSVIAAVRSSGDFISSCGSRRGMDILENLTAVRGAGGHAPAEIVGHDAFFSIADAVVRENFVHGPAPGAAVDAMGDGVPYVHDIAEVSV